MALQDILTTIDTLKTNIDALRPITPKQEQRINHKFRLDWNYHSNAIEGNTLSLGETRAFLLHGLTAKGKLFKDYLDMKGHNEAITYLENFVDYNESLNETHIQEIHRIMLVEPYEVDAITPEGLPIKRPVIVGQYKTMPNRVQTDRGEINSYYATPEETPARMKNLMNWYEVALKKNDLHPLIIAATFHYQLISIQPFDGGNGRMARLLMNLILMRAGYAPAIIKVGLKEDYMLALEQAASGNMDEFINLNGQALINSLELRLRGAKGESIETLDDIDKKIALLEKRLKADKIITATQKDLKLQERLYENLIGPLLEGLFTKFVKFETFFNRSWCKLIYEDDSVANDQVGFQNSFFMLIKLSDDMSDFTFNRIEIIARLTGFIKNENFSLGIHLIFNLRKYKFDVRYVLSDHSEQELTRGNYDRVYGEEEIKEMTFLIADQVYNVIEQFANA